MWGLSSKSRASQSGPGETHPTVAVLARAELGLTAHRASSQVLPRFHSQILYTLSVPH